MPDSNPIGRNIWHKAWNIVLKERKWQMIEDGNDYWYVNIKGAKVSRDIVEKNGYKFSNPKTNPKRASGYSGPLRAGKLNTDTKKRYYCRKCRRDHNKKSKIGKSHRNSRSGEFYVK